MKPKQLLFLLALLLIVGQVTAQTHIGLKGGLNGVNNNLSGIQWFMSDDNAYRLGYHAGIFSHHHIQKN